MVRSSTTGRGLRAGILSLILLSVLSAAAAGQPAREASSAQAPYVRRGDQVEERYRDLNRRVEQLYQDLLIWVDREAPWLKEELMGAPPERARYGYQILPEIGEDSPPPQPRPRPRSTSYSWPITERMIRDEETRLELLLEGKVQALGRMEPLERQSFYAEMVADYRTVRSGARLIDRHIQHNRLWQKAVALNPGSFEDGTRLHDAVLERQAILEALAAEDLSSFQAALRRIDTVDLRGSRSEVEERLRRRERRLEEQIQLRHDSLKVPDFVRILEGASGQWLIQVPVLSDIQDEDFLRRFKAAVEGHWRFGQEGTEFQVQVEVSRIDPAELYGESGLPKPGAELDVDRHAALFPAEAAALTTGASSVQVRGAGCILLGPQPVQPRVLAHEFGHVLGFRDGYFRGYRDLGGDGYEIVEILPDYEDIMTSPGMGEVQRRHFERLLEAVQSR